ncbi:Ig-like domain-containing protein [Streptomyces sp. NBC_01808]|uniref:L,D-transpeptidase n=1 Tax=Streptomyces sp. NBC_01808 TaxID=2975947 RepID=UPI002DDB8C50|nr:Ig-like domain-containing protein [Streptomyces sp. NBC_01808]WSA40788.1 Ig-like domain-containing protein [Streptomyces sp. NBC_01808]
MKVERIRRGRTRHSLAALLTGTVLVVVTACGGSDGGDGDGGKGGSGGSGSGGEEQKVSQAVVAITPKDGADAVGTQGELKVTADKGKLVSVKVADEKGTEVKGEFSENGAEWKPTGHLRTQTEYKVHAVAKDSEGLESAKDTTFTTVVPENTFIGHFTPEDGSTVGVGMPVSINFNQPIANMKEVEEAIEVTADSDVEIEGHWFGNQRLDFRPEEYWEPGTNVTLSLRLDGVEGADGVYGEQHKDVGFEIGRRQVSTVDADSKKMKVERNGKNIKTIPVTTGAPSTPTWNGKMVITEQLEVTRMDGDTVGFGGEYDIKDVPHAQRLSTSGTFIHGNYWSGQATFGSANASHGCIGLYDARGGGDKSTPGSWFFRNSLIGDVVEVKNAKDEVIAPDNGLNGWNMSWEEWTAPQ